MIKGSEVKAGPKGTGKGEVRRTASAAVVFSAVEQLAERRSDSPYADCRNS